MTEKKRWSISTIEVLTEAEASELSIESMVIKEHNVYFVDFGGNWGYSALVYADNHHIHYADDYQLHHSKDKSRDDLRQWYIDALNNKLFTEAELREPIKDYDEYTRKSHFISNYFCMRRDYVSFFFIGSDEQRAEREKYIENRGMISNPIAFCYFDKTNKDFSDHLIELNEALEKRRAENENNFTYLKDAFLREMWNHEYIYNSYQGNYDVLSCFGHIEYDECDDETVYFDQLNFDDTHRKAFYAAKKEYFRKVEQMDL